MSCSLRTLLLLWLSLVSVGLNPLVVKAANPPDTKQSSSQKETASTILLSEDEQSWLSQHPKIRVRISRSYPPFEFFEDGHYQGMAYDFLQRVGKDLGVEFVPVEGLSWAETLKQIKKQQRVDLVLLITQTKERESFLNFTRNYISFPIVIYTRQESPVISGIEDLTGKTVAMEAGFIEAEELKRDVPGVKLLETENSEAALEAVATGRAGAYVGNLAVSSYLINKRGFFNLKVAAPLHDLDDPYAMATRKDWPQLAVMIDRVLTTMGTAERRDIRQKWLSIRYDYGIDWPSVWRWAGGVGGVLCLLIAGSLYWNQRLVREIRMRRETERALQSSEKRFRGLVEGIGSEYILYTRDLDRRFTYVSPSAASLSGFSQEKLIGHTLDDLPFEEASKERSNRSAERCLQGESPPPFEMQFLHPDGGRRFLIVDHHPTYDDDGKITGIEGIIKNITKDKKNELALREAKESAEEATRAKSIFLSNMSHELRTPLTSILGYSQLLQRSKDLPELLRAKVDTINRNGQHLRQIINDVLEVSQIEAGHLTLSPVNFNLHTLLADIEQMVKLSAEEKNLRLIFKKQFDISAELFADEGKLRQILINLLSNAIKFTDQGEITVQVMLEVSDANEWFLDLSVSDTGLGISAEERDKLFLPFEQASLGRQRGGSGLGLVISREYARLMNGDLQVSSIVGQGSTFTLRCQVAEGKIKDPATVKVILGLELGSQEKRILIADDMQESRQLLRQLLTTENLMIAEATNGEEALRMIAAEQPDLVIMDMKMPLMSGKEAIRLLRKEQKNTVPIIAVSASIFETDRAEVISAGADMFLSKPIDEQALYQAVSLLLGIGCIYQEG